MKTGKTEALTPSAAPRRRAATLAACLLALATICGPRPAGAQQAEPALESATHSAPLRWTWRRSHPADYVATGLFAAGAAVTELAPSPADARWVGGNAFDDVFRDTFELSSFDARAGVARASDLTLAALVLHTIVIDPALVAFAHDGSEDVAWQLEAIDLQAVAFTLAATGLSKRAFARERPSTTACRDEAGVDRRCTELSASPSFFSGHTSLAFTAASLTCSHHAHLPIYGGDGDVLACVAAVFAAATVGFERVVSDRHYASDVLVGAAVGTASGALLPWVSFYRHVDPETQMSFTLGPRARPDGAALSVTGLF